jgi:hypothetical protein
MGSYRKAEINRGIPSLTNMKMGPIENKVLTHSTFQKYPLET